ncbi:ATP-binding protein [uncultured Enterovirga sp.]|uniref:ATP-binding protein n=1 Tax=uncultured Enterovirga sp. TaxID=2026352 RepID=UPI0035CAE7F3
MERSEALEWALRGFLDRRQPDWELTAYVAAEDGQAGPLSGALDDRVLRVVVSLRGGGGFAVMETSGRMDVLLRRAFGIPPGFWVAVIGFIVSERRQRVDVVDLAAIEVAEHEARGASVELAASTTASVIVECDPLALRRVLANLLGNATTYASRTEVTVRAHRGVCRVTVDDDGPGIPEAERTAIFSPFYLIDGSRNRVTGGNGLARATVKIGLANLVYNMRRAAWLTRQQAIPA